jgi:hypothetical protein
VTELPKVRYLDNWIESYMKYVSDSESPTLFHKWAAVSTIASTTTRFTYITLGQWTFYLNFFILLVAPPGVCRKGDAINISRDLIRDYNHIHLACESLTREYLLNLFASSREYFINTLQKKMNKGDAKKVAPSAITVHSGEFGVFLGQGDVRFINDLTDLYDCKTEWKYGTIKHDLRILDNTWLNILGAITPSAIREVLPDFAIGGGFLSRFILVAGRNKRKKISLMDVRDRDVELYNKLKSDIGAIHRAQGNMSFSKRAAAAYTDWYMNFDESRPPANDPRLLHYNTRKPAHLIKLSGVMSLAKSNSMIISLDDFKEALELLNETEPGMSDALVGVGRSKISPLVQEISMSLKKAGMLTYNDIFSYHAHDATKEDVNQALEILVAQGVTKLSIMNKEKVYRYVKVRDRKKGKK